MDKPSQSWKGRGLRFLFVGAAIAATVAAVGLHNPVVASDHDDGETNIKSRNLNLTDLYVFREDWETGNTAADAGKLVMVMNTNPRSVPRQQYFFNTDALYNFHVSRRANRNDAVSGQEDMRFEYQFSPPDASGQQAVQLQIHRFSGSNIQATETFAAAGKTQPAPAVLTTTNGAPLVNTVNSATRSTPISFFAGLREDPFFFDVESFFKVRAALVGSPGARGAQLGFLDPSTAQDFAYQYNVNSIVQRVPISFLQANNETVFDVWETITVPTSLGKFQSGPAQQ